jgi:hypothetical protein
MRLSHVFLRSSAPGAPVTDDGHAVRRQTDSEHEQGRDEQIDFECCHSRSLPSSNRVSQCRSSPIAKQTARMPKIDKALIGNRDNP